MSVRRSRDEDQLLTVWNHDSFSSGNHKHTNNNRDCPIFWSALRKVTGFHVTAPICCFSNGLHVNKSFIILKQSCLQDGHLLFNGITSDPKITLDTLLSLFVIGNYWFLLGFFDENFKRTAIIWHLIFCDICNKCLHCHL